MKNDYDQSFKIAKKMIDDNPNDFENNYILEMFYLRIGMPHDAIKYVSRAIELNPLNFDVYGDRGNAYELIGNEQNAIRNARLCLSINPNAIACKVLMTRNLLWINDFQNAEKYITELEQLTNTEKSPQVLLPGSQNAGKNLRAFYLAKLGKKDHALALSRNTPVYEELGMAHEALQKMKEWLTTSMYPYYPSYEILSHHPKYEHIRNDPEFQEFMHQQKTISDEMIRKYRIK